MAFRGLMYLKHPSSTLEPKKWGKLLLERNHLHLTHQLMDIPLRTVIKEIGGGSNIGECLPHNNFVNF